MYKITAVLFVVFLAGCARSSENDPVVTSIDQHTIGYEVKHTHVDSSKNTIDIYSVVIYKDGDDTVKLSKYNSKSDSYYYLTYEYSGANPRSMSGAVTVDIDGFVFDYQDYDPYTSNSPEDAIKEAVTVILNKFVVHNMRSAKNLQVEYQFEPSLTIPAEGIENIDRFVAEMDAL